MKVSKGYAPGCLLKTPTKAFIEHQLCTQCQLCLSHIHTFLLSSRTLEGLNTRNDEAAEAQRH